LKIKAEPDVSREQVASINRVQGYSQVDAYSSHKPVPLYQFTRCQNPEF